MEKEFIPYEQALALKELGFNEPCFGYYNNADSNVWVKHTIDESIKNIYKGDFNAPTFSQAFRWFREKYNLKGHVEAIEYFDETPDTYHWNILNECNSGNDQLTYEEAELECLKKLIEICQK